MFCPGAEGRQCSLPTHSQGRLDSGAKLFRDVDALVIGIIKDALNPPKTEPDEKGKCCAQGAAGAMAAVRTAG